MPPPRQCPLPVQTLALPLSPLQEKRKRQTEIENKRRQLEDDRRQLQHLKVRVPGTPGLPLHQGRAGDPPAAGCQDHDSPSAPQSKALRERWLLEGAPASASEEDEAMKKQMQEDEVKTKELEETIQR